MPAKAGHRKAPDAEPPEKPEDKYDRVRSLLTVCVQLLATDDGQGTPHAQAAPTPDLSKFSDRELEFLRWVQQPETWPYDYIALQMGLPVPTLHYLRHKLFEKLGVNSRPAMAAKVRDWVLL